MDALWTFQKMNVLQGGYWLDLKKVKKYNKLVVKRSKKSAIYKITF